ncbi:unnamed protein product, partial [Fusarium graminearum]
LRGLKQHVVKKTSCGKTVLFSKADSVIVGLYVSADMGSIAATTILEHFEKVASEGTQIMQACDINLMNPYTFGVFAIDKISDFELVRKHVQTWASGYCAAMPLTRPKDVRTQVNIPGGDLFIGSSNATSVAQSGLPTDLEARAECKTTKVGDKDTCTTLTIRCNIRGADFVKYNTKQNLCSTLKVGQLKPGTKKPSGSFDGWDLAKLNQCPLNSCCSGWGFYGTTSEFYTESPADTKAPGAFKLNTNGCISNCGTDIVNNKSPPKEFKRIGYFQAYNPSRPCMNMDATEIAENFEELTHVYFTFAGITADYDVNISDDVKKQFEIFDKMDAPFKKILSFGGWAESTDAATFQRYRDVVKPEHRSVFAANVVKFMAKHISFDGVDIDLEYPGATDQGIPAGDRTDGLYYYRFLSPFPVDQMAEVLDYFVFMTYDLHGQWDYGNKFANPGCDNGNCLRSHINRTETRTSLSMITKAGVPAEKVIVGIASYGRSFRMADKSCTGPDCLFTGSFEESEAEPGQCTGTGGYISNAEINEIWQLVGQRAEVNVNSVESSELSACRLLG